MCSKNRSNLSKTGVLGFSMTICSAGLILGLILIVMLSSCTCSISGSDPDLEYEKNSLKLENLLRRLLKGNKSSSLVEPRNVIPGRESSENVTQNQKTNWTCVREYPEEQIEKLLRQSPELQKLFKTQKVPSGSPSRNADGTRICETKHLTDFPKSRLNTKNECQIIVNSDRYFQPVYIEQCSRSGPCFKAEQLDTSVNTSCATTMADIKLYVFENGSIKRDVFEVPCGCVCLVKEN